MKAEVKNAADESQVKNAVDNIERRDELEKNDIIAVLNTVEGRRLIWRILDWTGCEGTPKRNDDALTYMAIGSGDVGRWLKSEIVKADERLLLKIMQENMEVTDARTRRS